MPEKKFVFVITESYEKPNRVAGALQLATNMRALDIEVDFFLMDSGVLLAREGFAESLIWQSKGQFSQVAELMKTLIDDFDTKFFICASCVKHHELDSVPLIKNSEIKPGSFLAEMLLERQGMSF